ncbi:hypothetical protein P7K49_010671 [Saguinus oedipus]|uniref:Uncharacterized protein n=1 Tax=Saguinus oedipus TaxID=9490 RepID=A0ABQ9VP88_SAGOE|nr:hypothetical protein P7K49_010671 [Saguinus oedipus]
MEGEKPDVVNYPSVGSSYWNTVDRETVDIRDLDNVLGNMGIELTKEELRELTRNLPVDAKGQTNLKSLMDTMQVITGGEVDFNDLENVLQNMGIELASREQLELEKLLPVDANGKIYKNRLLNCVKNIKELQVNVHDIDSILRNMALKLTAEELNDLTPTLPGRSCEFCAVCRCAVAPALLNRPREPAALASHVSPTPGTFNILWAKKVRPRMQLKLTLCAFTESCNPELPLRRHLEARKVDIENLDTILDDMGIKLTDKELEDLKQSLPVGGEKIDAGDLLSILKHMGIELTGKEHKQLLKTLPIDANGKVFLNRLRKDVKYNKRKVNVNNLDAILEVMEVKLREKELDIIKDLLSNDGPYGKYCAYENVDLKNLTDSLEAVTGEEVDVDDMKTILGNMGIELTDKELTELVYNLPVDGDSAFPELETSVRRGTSPVYSAPRAATPRCGKTAALATRVMLATRAAPPNLGQKGNQSRGKIDSSKVDTVLENMGINLTEKELEDLTQNLPVDVNGKVDLRKVMNEIKYFTGDKVDTNKPQSVLGNLGIELMPNELLNLLKTLPVNADGKVYQKRLMKGMKSLEQGNVDVNKLDTLLENLGIKITEEEFMDLTERLPDDCEHCNHPYTFLGNFSNQIIKISMTFQELREEPSASPEISCISECGGEVDVSDLEDALKDMGIEFTYDDYLHLVKTLPLDAEGKVYKKRLLDGIKTIKNMIKLYVLMIQVYCLLH